jgi:ankyrin repeat protein
LYGLTRLDRACVAEAAVYELIELGSPASFNVLDGDGSTSLIDASRHGHARFVKALLRAGADVNSAPYDGSTEQIEACFCGQQDCAALYSNLAGDESRPGSLQLHKPVRGHN